jgi:hypothetical protein
MGTRLPTTASEDKVTEIRVGVLREQSREVSSPSTDRELDEQAFQIMLLVDREQERLLLYRCIIVIELVTALLLLREYLFWLIWKFVAMEMTAEYMRETAAHLEKKGYRVDIETDSVSRDDQNVFNRTRYACIKGESEHFVMECLSYSSGTTSFFLEICKYFDIYSHSFPLDSWKYRDHQIEFKYLAERESGLGLSFVLKLPAVPNS